VSKKYRSDNSHSPYSLLDAMPLENAAQRREICWQLQQTLSDFRRTLAIMEIQAQSNETKIKAILKTQARIGRRFMQLCSVLARAQVQAYRDELTGLPNRALFLDRLNQVVLRATRAQRKIALLFVDLDGFKEVNDTFGHATGDRLLRQVADRITSCLRSEDTACRYGGDEFLIMLPEVDDRSNGVNRVADKIHWALSRPYLLDNELAHIGASIGTAIYPTDGTVSADLIKKADAAMYSCKRSRRV